MSYENKSVDDMAFDLMGQAEKEGDLFAGSAVSTSNQDVLNMVFSELDKGDPKIATMDDVTNTVARIQSEIPKSTNMDNILNSFIDKVRTDPYLSNKYEGIMSSLVENPESGLVDYNIDQWKKGGM